MKTQWLIIMLDLAVMLWIITYAEQSPQAGILSIVAFAGAILIGSRMIGAWLWKIEDKADKRPL